MKIFHNQRVLILLLLSFSLFILGSNAIISKKNSVNPQPLQTNSSEQESIKRSIESFGAKVAYNTLKKDLADKPYGQQHTGAHVFGETLYDKLGVEGVSVCDSSFGFGCYHSFLGIAIAKEGMEVLPQFNKACEEKYGDLALPCKHGIGHGIISYLGNDKLMESLNECRKLSQEPMGGCTSGVFMEYNFRTMDDPKGEEILTRQLDNDPYDPCASLSEKFQQSCYFEQVQWWETVFKGDYDKIGALCSDLENKLNQQACFHGVGNYAAPFSGHNAEKTADLCSKMPNEQGQAFCVEGASWIFLGMGKKDEAYSLCQILESEFTDECTQKLDVNPANKK